MPERMIRKVLVQARRVVDVNSLTDEDALSIVKDMFHSGSEDAEVLDPTFEVVDVIPMDEYVPDDQ